jgi:2-dehydropantoate 2-reductase
MKTLILGTGIIGTIYGWALAESGVDITHYVRKGKSAAYKGGVTIDLLDERKGHQRKNITQYTLKCVEEISPADNYDLIILPTNSYQTEEALQTLIPNSGTAIFLILSANWEGSEFIDRLLSRERYLLGYPDGGGTRRDGVYWTNLGAEVHLGEVDGKLTPKLEQVRALFVQADMQPDVQDNILHWLWLHNAMSIGIWAGFAKYREVKPFLKDRPLLVQCYRATKELLELCRLRGVDLKRFPETNTFRLPAWLFIILFRWLWTHNESMQRFTAHGADSLQEARANYEAILRTANELGFDMPNLKMVGRHLEVASQ